MFNALKGNKLGMKEEHFRDISESMMLMAVQSKMKMFIQRNARISSMYFNDSPDPKNIRRVMLVFVGIVYYDDMEPSEDALEDVFSKDFKNYKDVLVEQYGYVLCSNLDADAAGAGTGTLTFRELNNFLIACHGKLVSGHFEGLVVALSGHGTESGLMCSDGLVMEHEEIRSIFAEGRVSRIPQVFLVDACRVEDAEEEQKDDEHNAAGGALQLSVSKTDAAVETELGNDHLSVTVYASKKGMATRGGMLSQFMTAHFAESKGNEHPFGVLCDKVREAVGNNNQEMVVVPGNEEILDVVFRPNYGQRGRRQFKGRHNQSDPDAGKGNKGDKGDKGDQKDGATKSGQ